MTSIVPVPPSEPTSTDLATTSAHAPAEEELGLEGPDRALGFDKRTLGFVVFMVALSIIGFVFMP